MCIARIVVCCCTLLAQIAKCVGRLLGGIRYIIATDVPQALSNDL